jgi:hypothetical protein
VSRLSEHGSVKSMNIGSIFGATSATPGEAEHYMLRFRSLFDAGRALVFPCNAKGDVMLDLLSERARTNYLYARAVVGREFGVPEVLPCDLA